MFCTKNVARMFKIIILIELLQCIYANECTIPSIPKYHLIEKCNRSNLGIAAKANFASLTSCKRLGIEKRGLALNFMPAREKDRNQDRNRDSNQVKNQDRNQDRNPNRNQDRKEFSCEVLKCAEVDGGLSLSNDTRYDYYSIYAKHIPHKNTTCVPGIGMFYLLESTFNYTQAQTSCMNMSGVLADVTSEQRTDALAQVLSSAGVAAAYVGLTRANGSTFHGLNGNGLYCSTYRAWAPGYPQKRSSHRCVVLTKQHTWKTTNCKSTYPSLCELVPTGPYKQGTIFLSETDVIDGFRNRTYNQQNI